MQQRVPIKSFTTFPEAHEAKIDLLIQFPDNNYQIRKGRKGFVLSHRFKVNELKQKEGNSTRVRNKFKRRANPRTSQVL